MKLISWNVNGLRAVRQKGFDAFLESEDPDFFCVQETKMQPEQADFSFDGYRAFWCSAEKKGYSGTLTLARREPLAVRYGIDGEWQDEGRLITLECEDFFLVNSYSPNAQNELRRIDYRLAFEKDLRAYLKGLSQKKGVILCGDLNVAHQPIDLKHPEANTKNPGFSPEERGAFSALLSEGFTDSFRYLYPEARDAYSWWSYRMRARERNVGWRIDYFVVSDSLRDRIADSVIRADIFGSDHCPVTLLLK